MFLKRINLSLPWQDFSSNINQATSFPTISFDGIQNAYDSQNTSWNLIIQVSRKYFVYFHCPDVLLKTLFKAQKHFGLTESTSQFMGRDEEGNKLNLYKIDTKEYFIISIIRSRPLRSTSI